MTFNRVKFARLASLIPALILAGCLAQEPVLSPADTVFRGGAIYTMDPALPWAGAVAVEKGRIVYVGDERGAERWVGPGTDVIELGEAMLMPAFHDAHMHPMAAGTTYLRCPLDGLGWPTEVLAKLEDCAARLEAGEWLRATGLAEEVLAGQGPGVKLLDGISQSHPAIVSTSFGDRVWLNSMGLSLAGIDRNTIAPEGGEIERDPQTGQPTGVLGGAAVLTAWKLASHYPESALRNGLELASRMANRLGITAAGDASASELHWKAYRAAEAAGEMTLRVNASLRWDPSWGWEKLRGLSELRDLADGPRFRSDSIKLFLDGSSGNGDASVLEPYEKTGGYGVSFYAETLAPLVVRLDLAGFNVHMHAYGDRAVRDGLDAIAQAVNSNPPRARRHRLAHVALIDGADMPRMAELGVTADIQPLWAWMSEERREECEWFGPSRCDRLLAFRNLFDSGARVAAGSDWISESMSPLYNIQVAVTRRPPDASGPAWNPDQRVSLKEMLKAYTLDAAWILGLDQQTGSIIVGKAADLIVLERNLFEVDPMKLKDVRVEKTFLAGEVVHEMP